MHKLVWNILQAKKISIHAKLRMISCSVFLSSVTVLTVYDTHDTIAIKHLIEIDQTIFCHQFHIFIFIWYLTILIHVASNLFSDCLFICRFRPISTQSILLTSWINFCHAQIVFVYVYCHGQNGYLEKRYHKYHLRSVPPVLCSRRDNENKINRCEQVVLYYIFATK